MFISKKTVVGLDIGSKAIKAVELSRSGKEIRVSGFGQAELQTENPAERVRAVSDLLREGNFHTKNVVTSVSGKMVIVRYLNMVRMSDEELRNAILFEAEKYIPFTLDECVMDCQRLEVGDSGQQGGNANVLLVAIKRTALDDHLSLAQQAGVTPEVVDVDAFALSNVYNLITDQTGNDETRDGAVAFVDIGSFKTSVNIMHDGVSLFSREVYVGGDDFTSAISRSLNLDEADAEALKRNPGDNLESVQDAVFPIIDDLGNELQLSFDYFETQYNRGIEKIYLSGGGSRFSFFRESFEKIFEKPTAVFNPFDHLQIADGIDPDHLEGGGRQLVVATGLASRILKG